MLGSWRTRSMIICLALPMTNALPRATRGTLFTQILRLPTLPMDPVLAPLLILNMTRCSAIPRGVVQATLCRRYLLMLHPGCLSLHPMNLSAVALPKLPTGNIDRKMFRTLLLLPRFLFLFEDRNRLQESPRILTRPGTLSILWTPLQQCWTCPRLIQVRVTGLVVPCYCGWWTAGV